MLPVISLGGLAEMLVTLERGGALHQPTGSLGHVSSPATILNLVKVKLHVIHCQESALKESELQIQS